MKYCEFERFFSQKRLNRYLLACQGDKRKAMTLFSWMGIDSNSMLYGLDHVLRVCDKIDGLR